MKYLILKAFGGLLFLMIAMAAALFLPAGRLNYWQAWTFLIVFGVSALTITLYLMKMDPKLLERRVYAGPTAEKEPTQKIIQFITSIGFIIMLIVPGLDHRFGWSVVPQLLTIFGNALIAAGFIIIFFVYRQNTFTSATIEVYSEQKVISTGLYSFVRHPMYFGSIFLFIGMPLALGSWWDYPIYILMMPALLWRLFDEEKFLIKNLPGYIEYRNKVKYRLIPFIW